MKMTGMHGWLLTRRRCSSSPLIPGMRTSRIRQSVSRRRSELKNSSADANTSTPNVTDLSRPRRDSRTESSSSTTEMRAAFSTWDLSLRPRSSVFSEQDQLHLRIGGRAFDAGTLVPPYPQLLGHSDQVCQRACPHLVHHLAPVDLHGDFAGAQFCGDLLVE